MERQENPKMDWKAKDLHTAFKRFKEHVNFMFESLLSNKTEAIWCNYLMLWVGDKGRHIYSTWTIGEGGEKKLKTYNDKFEEYCKPKSNKIYNRYIFKSQVQNANENYEQFVTEFKTLVKDWLPSGYNRWAQKGPYRVRCAIKWDSQEADTRRLGPYTCKIFGHCSHIWIEPSSSPGDCEPDDKRGCWGYYP